jgi:hypothetical protein
MKRAFRIFIITAFMAIAPMLMLAQNPPHPGDGTGGDPTGSGTEVGGTPPAGAPIGNGTLILLTLAMAYAGRKVYVMQSAEQPE